MKWMKKTFEEVVLFARTGLNPRQNFKLGQGNNNYITIKNIKNNSLVIDDNTDVVDDEAIKLIHKRSQIKKGDVLFASIGRMGDMFIIEEEPIGWDINESVFAFTLNTNIVKQKYFYYIFRVKSTLDYLISNSSGSTFKSIKMNQLKKMVFDIPQLEEQDYIISVLDKVCDVIEKRKQELEFLDNLIKARFVEMFGNIILNDKGWKTDTWSNALKIVNGKNQKAVESDDGEYLICGSGGAMGRATEYLTNENSVIIGRKGSINKPLLMREKYWNVDTAFGIEPNRKYINVDYLYMFCVFFNFEQLNKAVTIPSLTKADLLNIEMPIPNILLQEQFADFVKQVDKSKFMKSF